MDLTTLKKEIESNENVWLLLFKKGSQQSDCAYENFIKAGEKVKSGNTAKTKEDFFCYADVNEVKDIHPEYNITTVPSMLHFEKGKLKNIVKGCHAEEQFYSIFENAVFKAPTNGEAKPKKNVVVYTSPTCTWCNAVKRHLNEHGVIYREVDVSRDMKVAEELVRRSGQQGVPQTDINGQIIVGFDKSRINTLLGIN
jgi:glutaredoxin-like YruB-family protein